MTTANDIETPVPGTEPEDRTSVLEVLRFVLHYWRDVPWRFAGMLVGTTLGVVLEVQIPRLSANLVVAIERHLAGTIEANVAWDTAWSLLGIFAAVFVVKQLYMRNWMYLASQVMQKLVNDGFRRVQRFSLEWHTNNFAGSTQRKITRGMWAYDSLADTLVVDLGPALGLLVGFTVAMSLRDATLGIYFGIAVVVFVAVSIAMSLTYVAPANVLSNDADTVVGGALADAITCNGVVKSFGAEEREDSRFGESSHSWRWKSRRAWLRSMDAGAVQSGLLLLLLGGLLWLVLMRSQDALGRVEGAVYVITTYLVVHSYLRNIGWQVRNAQRAVNELDDLVEIARTDPQVHDAPGAREFAPGAGHIEFRDVTFGYDNQPAAIFQGLAVDIRAGEKLALVGESGSGKSTFAKLLQRLYDIDAGQVVIDGQDVSRVPQDSLRRSISVVPQDPVLFHRTLAENIGYARPGAELAEVHRPPATALRHPGRRTRDQAIRRRAPARRDRARNSRRRTDSRARRGDVEPRLRHRAPDPGRAHQADRGPHGGRDRAPPVHDPSGRPHPGVRRRSSHRRRHPRGARPPPRRPLPQARRNADLHHAGRRARADVRGLNGRASGS